jgi:hypothetical protein
MKRAICANLCQENMSVATKENFDLINNWKTSLHFLVWTEYFYHLDKNFKSRQKFHHGLKEHHNISNIPKFRCEML